MTTSTMNAHMHAQLQAQTRRGLDETSQQFARSISAHGTLPMTTLTNTIKFAITDPADGAREWTLAVTLTEMTTPDGNPTIDHNIVTS